MGHCWNDSDRRKSNYRRETCRTFTLSVTNYMWTGLRCDTCKNKRLGHGTTEHTPLAEEGVMKIMHVSGFQVDCFLYFVHKSFEVT